MGLRMLLAGGAGLLLGAALTSQASAHDRHRPGPELEMPFDLVANFEIVVEGQLGELHGLKFILDTGSSYSAVDRRVADRMGMRRRAGTVFNFDRNRAIEWADFPELRIGPIRVVGIGMMVTRLADVSAFAENVDGIIGMDVLSRTQRISIDYERRRILFKLGETRANDSSSIKAFVVPVNIQGVPMRLLLDTGLEYLLLYKDRLRSALPHLRTQGKPRDGVLGHLPTTQVNLPGVQILGPAVLTPVLLIEGPGKAALGGVDGYLGPAALRAKRLELDFAANALRWQ